MDRRRSGLIDALLLEGQPLVTPGRPAVLELTAADGSRYTSLGPADEVVVEEAGPLRATVRVGGHYRAADGRRLFAYTLRLHAYAGQRFVRIEHSWANDFTGAEFTSIRALRLKVLLAGSAEGGGWLLGGVSDEPRPFSESRSAELRQHTDNRYTVAKEDQALIAEGERSPGWAEWRQGGRRLTLAVRDFWQTYPKDLAVGREGFELGICPPLRSDEYATARGTVDEYRLYYYLQGGEYKFKQGVSQTQDIWLEAGPESEAAPAAIRTQRSPLRAVAPAQWYADSKAFGSLAGPGTTGLLARYDRAFERSFREYLADRELQRSYGMLNFGDWYGEREINWGNSEYDTQHCFLMQFVRTGEPKYFLAAEQMERHNRDVDTIRYDRDPSRVGGVYQHAIGHTGGYYAKSPVPGKGFVRPGLSVDHAWSRGHLDYYFLTGERRSLETARLVVDRTTRTRRATTTSGTRGWRGGT